MSKISKILFFSLIILNLKNVMAEKMFFNPILTKNNLERSECEEKKGALWVNVDEKKSGCYFYYASFKEGKAAVIFIPGDVNPQITYPNLNPDVLIKSAFRTSQAINASFIYIARPGLMGSTGDFLKTYHTETEIVEINAVLDELKVRFGITKFALAAQSAGGLIATGILSRRSDIKCAVIASGLLSIVDFTKSGKLTAAGVKREMKKSYDPILNIDKLKQPVPPLYFLADPQDSVVPIKGQRQYYDAIRSKGIDATWVEINSADPEHHVLEARAIIGAGDCLADKSSGDIVNAVRKKR
ncbi:alpha/beta hydrolase family protein [Duganella radicis]|uniref:Alpha/beta hydrolase n=1 Tax=Duganella radicis TaxID=551988 RepID=A0A6L6PNK5_9BURK|nr:hypothetical protein [Duganella radicis]MTV40553.1 hypothetical protein [Duganella radicis]